MLHFVAAMKWVYISVVYAEGSYGENAAKFLKLKSGRFGVCIAVLEMVASADETEMNRIVEKLLNHRNARVVVTFLEGLQQGDNFVAALKNRDAASEFIFVGSDTTFVALNGMFGVQPVRQYNTSTDLMLEEYMNSERFTTHHTKLVEFLTHSKRCARESNMSDCVAIRKFDFLFQLAQTYYLKSHDIVHLYAKAFQKALNKECAHIETRNKTALRSCVKGYNVTNNLKETEYVGAFSTKLDPHGDNYAKYDLYQVQYVGETLQKVFVGIYDELVEPKISLALNVVDWSVYRQFSQQTLEIDREEVGVPESVCSKPCKKRQYYVQKELPCCWECKTCKPNEYILNDTNCISCPFGFWPDDERATQCDLISKTYLKFDNLVTYVLVAFALCGVLASIIVFAFYIRKRDEKIIKATQRELCFLILFGILMAYLTVLLHTVTPRYWPCLMSRHGFNVSIATIYVPLLVKTVRVYRIFKATQTGMRHLDVNTQLVLVLLLLILQVSLLFQEILFSMHTIAKLSVSVCHCLPFIHFRLE